MLDAAVGQRKGGREGGEGQEKGPGFSLGLLVKAVGNSSGRYGTRDGDHRDPWGIHVHRVILVVVGSMGYMRYPEPARAHAILATVLFGSAQLLPTRAV